MRWTRRVQPRLLQVGPRGADRPSIVESRFGARCSALLGLACLSACGDLRDAYGKEYVLYDSRRSTTAASPANQGAIGAASTVDPAFARILLLEQLRAEIERAILDGSDHDGVLARKRREVDAELQARLEAAAPSDLARWRAARVQELEAFATEAVPTGR